MLNESRAAEAAGAPATDPTLPASSLTVSAAPSDAHEAACDNGFTWADSAEPSRAQQAPKRPRTSFPDSSTGPKLPAAIALINEAYTKVLGHPDPSKRVDRFQLAYPEFWSRAVEQVPYGNKTVSRVRQGFEEEFRQLAEELARGGC